RTIWVALPDYWSGRRSVPHPVPYRRKRSWKRRTRAFQKRIVDAPRLIIIADQLVVEPRFWPIVCPLHSQADRPQDWNSSTGRDRWHIGWQLTSRKRSTSWLESGSVWPFDVA